MGVIATYKNLKIYGKLRPIELKLYYIHINQCHIKNGIETDVIKNYT
jgi:hypothetical protein